MNSTLGVRNPDFLPLGTAHSEGVNDQGERISNVVKTTG